MQRQRSPIVDAVMIGRSRDNTPLAPLAHGPAYVLSRHACHRSEVALTDLESQLDPAATLVFADVLRQVEQCPGQSSLDTEKCRRSQGVIGLSKPASEGPYEVARKLGVGVNARLKFASAEKQ